MKALLLALVCLVCAVNAAKQVDITCSASGDPHFINFVGDRYDFQASGYFTYVNTTNGNLLVQVQQQLCGNKVYCVRQFAAQFNEQVRGVEQIPCTSRTCESPYITVEAWLPSTTVVRFGSWPGTTDNVYIDGATFKHTTCVSKTNSPNPCRNGNGTVVAVFSGNTITVTHTSALNNEQVKIVWVINYGITVYIPNSWSTNGVCGSYQSLKPTTKTRYGYNGAVYANNQLYDWLSTWAVRSGQTLFSVHSHFDLATRREYHLQDVPNPDIPNSTVQAELAVVQFNNLDKVNEITQLCKKVGSSLEETDPAIQHCIYDAALMGIDNDDGLAMAVSNIATATAVPALDSNDSSSTNTQLALGLGIGLGGLALIGAVLAGVYVLKYRRTRSELDRALVLYNSNKSQPTSTGGAAAVPLQENL